MEMEGAAEPASAAIIDIPSADVLRLIQSHLVECGLHSSSAALRAESGGVGLPGLFPSSKDALVRCARDGRWGEALRLLDGLDLERARRGYMADLSRARDKGGRGEGGGDGPGGEMAAPSSPSTSSAIITPLEKSVAMAHEMTILELAERGEVDLAYATLRMCSGMLDRALRADDDDGDGDGDNADCDRRDDGGVVGMISSRSGDVERRITALSSARRSSSSAQNGGSGDDFVPADYYGRSGSRQGQRDRVAKLLKRHVPEAPPKRLLLLLQQSVKWQCHTGTFPAVRRLFQRQGDNGDCNVVDELGDEGEDEEKKKRKKKKKRKERNADQKFDLVLGSVDVTADGGERKRRRDGEGGHPGTERVPSRPHQTIRLGKKSYVESALFLPDGRGLVTGSSDGFVEIWGEPVSRPPPGGDAAATSPAAEGGRGGDDARRLEPFLPAEIDFEKLRTSDLAHQREDNIMMHDAPVLAIDVSHNGTLLGTTSADGTICVWKVSEGKLLRRLERAHGGIEGGSDKGAAVTCIQFSPDGSKILTGGHDSTCREHGLLASRMLKEFRGHNSYVNCCGYVVLSRAIASSERGDSGGKEGFLVVVTASADGTVRVWDGRTSEPMREIVPRPPAPVGGDPATVGPKSVHTVIHMHTPPGTMVVVPRSDRAYLVSYAGAILRTYARDDVHGTDFLAAVVSPGNRWLYVAANDGKCVAFEVGTGRAERIIGSFAEDTHGRGGRARETSGLVCHPHRGWLGGYSNDRGQKRGTLTIWK